MTTLPDLEPAALEAAIEAYDSFGGGPDTYLVKQVIRAYLSALSAPEAGKAVDDKANELLTKLWMVAAKLPQEPREDIASIIVALRALASVAPSGAEPIGCIDRFRQKYADAKTHAINTLIEKGWTPVYDSPQAVPAEDFAKLIAATEAELAAGSLSAMDWNTRSIALVRRLLAALARVTEERNAYIKACDDYERDLKHSEAEATSLRRKLEETERQRDEARAHHEYFAIQWDDQRIRAETAERKLEEHRKALEAFAAIADEYADQEDDDFQVWKDFDVLGTTLPLKHFRAARRTLSGASE